MLFLFFLDLSHLDTRVNIFLDGFEFHVYNRSHNYARMEQLFKSKSAADLQNPQQDVIPDETDSLTNNKK